MAERSIHDRIAHDLKAALSPIQTAAYVLRRGDGLQEGTTMELAAVIERQTRRLARMIDEASEWQRAADGRLSLRADDILPGELLEACLAATDGAPRVHWTTPADIVFRGDGYRLQQMLVAMLAFSVACGGERRPVDAQPDRSAGEFLDHREQQVGAVRGGCGEERVVSDHLDAAGKDARDQQRQHNAAERRQRCRAELAWRRPVIHDDAVWHVEERHAGRRQRFLYCLRGKRRIHGIEKRQCYRGTEAAKRGASRKLCHGLSPLIERIWNAGLLTIDVTNAENR